MKKRHKRSEDYHTKLLEMLRDPEEAVYYLNAALEEEDDPEAFLVALRNVAEAHGMADTAKKAGLNRESFYRMLSQKGNPRISSLHALLKTLGLTLRIETKLKEAS